MPDEDRSRRVYRGFAAFFLIVGGVFFALGLLRAWARPDLMDGDPLPVALLLLLIGGGLLWTARERGETGDGNRDADRDGDDGRE